MKENNNNRIRIDFLKDEDNEALLDLSRRCVQNGVISGYPDRSPVFNKLHKLLNKDSFHVVAKMGDKIIGCIGAIYTPVRVGDKSYNSFYILDFRVDEQYRKGITAYRIVRKAMDFIETGPAKIGFTNIIKGNGASHIFTLGRAGFPNGKYLGDIQVNNIFPLWKRKINSDYIIENPVEDDISELVGLYSKFYSTYKLAPSISRKLFLHYINEVEGMSLNNFWLARKDGKIKAVLCAWNENIYKRWWVSKIPFSRKLLFRLMKLFSVFIRMPAPIKENEALKQKTLVMIAHDQCLDGLRALLLHMNNIHLGKGYTVLQTHFHADDDIVEAQKGLLRMKVELHTYMTSEDPQIADEILSSPGPVHFEWPMFI